MRGILFSAKSRTAPLHSVISVTISLKSVRDIFRIVFMRDPAPFIQF